MQHAAGQPVVGVAVGSLRWLQWLWERGCWHYTVCMQHAAGRPAVGLEHDVAVGRLYVATVC